MLSNKTIQTSLNKNEAMKISPEFFIHKYACEEAFHYNSLQLSDVQKSERISFAEHKAEPLIAYFFSTFFVILSEHITHTEMTNFKVKQRGVIDEFIKTINAEEFIDYLGKTGYKYFPYIKAYYLTYKIKADKNIAGVYKELKEIFMKHATEFEETDTHMLWSVLCETLYLRLIPHDVPRYRREIFELNDYFLNLNVYPKKDEEYFTPQVFENIFSSAILAVEYEWAENFINKYGKLLHPDAGENQVNYCLGVLNFKLKKYEKSLDNFSKVKYSDIITKINLRFYTLLNYIEMKHYESALSLIDSAKHFTDSNEKVPKFLTGFMTTSLKIFKKIILAEAGVKELDPSVLKEAMEAKRFFQKSFAIGKIKLLLEKQERKAHS